MDISFGVSGTFHVQMDGHPLCIVEPSAAVYENHSQDTRYTGPLDTAPTVSFCNQDGIAVVEEPTYAMTPCTYTQIEQEKAPTLNARDFKDPTFVNAGYSVRRLIPTECARLQGFPDFWCADLDKLEPFEADIAFWTEVWETHRRVVGSSTKTKSRN